MKRALAVIALAGCGTDAPAPPGGDPTMEPTGSPEDPPADPNDPGTGSGAVTEVAGHITANTTWAEVIHVTAAVTVDPGVTLTIAPGTTVEFPIDAGLTVGGVLDIQGEKAARVTLRGQTGNFWPDVVVPRGGVMTARYLVQTGGGLHVNYTGKATIVDSHFSHVSGDLLVMSSGVIDMSYSAIGLEAGRDVMHCDLHIGGAPTVKITHSSFSAAGYALMFYGGVNADFTYNNWFGNAKDVITQGGPPVTGDFSYGYFASGVPTNPGITATHMASERIADAGPR